jgi:tetratricopeptide (TPR) repeat protein
LIAEIGPELANCRLAWATLIACREAKWLIMMAAPLKHYLQITGRVDEALTLLAQAGNALTGNDVSNRLAAATASRLMASALLLIGRVAEAQSKAESALPRCRALGDGEGTKACINLIGLALWRAGRGAEALPHFEEVLRLAEADRDLAAKAVALQNLSIIKSERDQLDAATALANRALEAHRIAGNVIGEVETLNILGNLWRRRGRHATAVGAYRDALALCDRHGLATERPFMLMNHAVSCLMTGDLAQAEVLYSDALVQARGAHVRQIEIGALQGLGRTAVRRGDFVGAVEPLRAGLVLAQSEGMLSVAAAAVCYVAEWLAAQGERGRAGVLLAVIVRLDWASPDVITLQSTLCLSHDEATAIDATAANLDLDGVAAMALSLLSATDPPVPTASSAR